MKTWFNKQVVKAKKFQPLAVINQKLKGLDVFESNDVPSTPTFAPAATSNNRVPTPERQSDPDEVVIRTHWQRSGYNDACTDPACGKRLGSVNGSVNCRKCGRLFCEEHTMYQMKLSRSAQHEPVRGFWCRVCETCFKSREGYNDHNGYIQDHTNAFRAIRSKKVDKTYLEVSRLEKRLTRLTQLLANPPEDVQGNTSILPFSGQRDQRKILEQSIVTWEDDTKVPKCPFCQQEFGSWSFRRHHCRLCGRVVCADTRTGCSSEIGLNVAGSKSSQDYHLLSFINMAQRLMSYQKRQQGDSISISECVEIASRRSSQKETSRKSSCTGHQINGPMKTLSNSKRASVYCYPTSNGFSLPCKTPINRPPKTISPKLQRSGNA